MFDTWDQALHMRDKLHEVGHWLLRLAGWLVILWITLTITKDVLKLRHS
jgi:hypothetical protein